MLRLSPPSVPNQLHPSGSAWLIDARLRGVAEARVACEIQMFGVGAIEHVIYAERDADLIRNPIRRVRREHAEAGRGSEVAAHDVAGARCNAILVVDDTEQRAHGPAAVVVAQC